jgi:sugar diacid utilization regulator
VLLREVRESGPPDLVAIDEQVLETAAHRFFNDLGAALADGYLQARRGNDGERTAAERELLGCLLESPPRLAEARRTARTLDLDLDVPWEVTVVSSERRAEGLTTRIRRGLWGADVLVGSCPAGLVVAVHRGAGAVAWPDLGRGVVCGVGDTHPDARGLRASYEEALEALELARRKGLRLLRFDDAWFDRFLLGAVSAEELAEVVLAPIASLTRNRRAAVLETLEAYLDSGSSVAAVADALHLHRQSVNYRMQNVRRLFGERLMSPNGRLALHIAVKAARLPRI